MSASGDGTLKRWDTRSGVELATLRGHTLGVNGCAISPDGSWIASASGDGTVKMWDVATGAERGTFRGHSAPVQSYAIAPDGSWIVSAAADGSVMMWDVARVDSVAVTGHVWPITGCAVAPNGAWLVSTSSYVDNTTKVWDLATGVERASFTEFPNMEGIGRATPAYARLEETLSLGNVHASGCAVARDGSWIACATREWTIKIRDVTTGTERAALAGHENGVMGIGVGPDGSWIVSASWDATVKVWDVATGAEQASLGRRYSPFFTGCVVAPDGSWVAASGADGTVTIWASPTGVERLVFPAHDGAAWACAVAPDGTWIVTGGADAAVRISDPTTGGAEAVLIGHTAPVVGCAVTPDGRWIVSTSRDRTLKVWEVATSAERASIPFTGSCPCRDPSVTPLCCVWRGARQSALPRPRRRRLRTVDRDGGRPRRSHDDPLPGLFQLVATPGTVARRGHRVPHVRSVIPRQPPRRATAPVAAVTRLPGRHVGLPDRGQQRNG